MALLWALTPCCPSERSARAGGFTCAVVADERSRSPKESHPELKIASVWSEGRREQRRKRKLMLILAACVSCSREEPPLIHGCSCSDTPAGKVASSPKKVLEENFGLEAPQTGGTSTVEP